MLETNPTPTEPWAVEFDQAVADVRAHHIDAIIAREIQMTGIAAAVTGNVDAAFLHAGYRVRVGCFDESLLKGAGAFNDDIVPSRLRKIPFEEAFQHG